VRRETGKEQVVQVTLQRKVVQVVSSRGLRPKLVRARCWGGAGAEAAFAERSQTRGCSQEDEPTMMTAPR
jgi:hypothetical protein